MMRHYVVQTTDPSAATTELAVQEMTAAGFVTTWLATLEQYTDRHRRTRTLRTSLFPGYVFVEFDVAGDDWMRIVSCRGVRNILGAGPLRPIALPIGALDKLRRDFEAGEFKPKSKSELVKGEHLSVVAGPFTGQIGVCMLSTGERVAVLLKMFGQERPLMLRSDMVRRVVA